MSAIEIKDGELKVHLSYLIRDETMLREIAKTVLFDELLLVAITSIALTGEVDWKDGEATWWMGSSDYGPRFEKLRTALVAIAPEAAATLIKDLTKQRDLVKLQSDEYQTRAWRAERLVKWNSDFLREKLANSERELSDISETCRVPAQAEIDTSKFFQP